MATCGEYTSVIVAVYFDLALLLSDAEIDVSLGHTYN